METLDQKELVEWQAYFQIRDKQERIDRDQRAIATATLMASMMSGEPVDITELFPEVEFEEPKEVQTSVEASKANFAKAMGVSF